MAAMHVRDLLYIKKLKAETHHDGIYWLLIKILCL